MLNNLPCKYGSSLHIISPNMKLRKIVPTNVNGIQNTPKNKSDTARLSKNRLVVVRIRLFCTSVRITREFPTVANRNMIQYRTSSQDAENDEKVRDIVAFRRYG